MEQSMLARVYDNGLIKNNTYYSIRNSIFERDLIRSIYQSRKCTANANNPTFKLYRMH